MHDCPLCGTWRCGECGWTRPNADRFEIQKCRRCGSIGGEMLIAGHRRQRSRDHYGEYAERLAMGRKLLYPLLPPILSGTSS